MRNELIKWTSEYPDAVAAGDDQFEGSAVAKFTAEGLPAAFRAVLGDEGVPLVIEGSAGKGRWTHTPWVALLDPTVTTSVQEGFYVVYLLSSGGERLYLTLNQGCTTLKAAIGMPGARDELARRAANVRAKLGPLKGRFKPLDIDLGSDLWRPSLYQAGEIVSVKYDTKDFPSEEVLKSDLQTILRLYLVAKTEGGWAAEDEILREADEDGLKLDLVQAKRYRQHRAIERLSSHARAVKKALGTKCMGCDREMGEIYGEIGLGLIHAHHLFPLSALVENQVVRLNPAKDFAVLCPNCHAIIHRLPDVGSVAALRALLST